MKPNNKLGSKIKHRFFSEVVSLTTELDSEAIDDIHKDIGNLASDFPLLHCEECAITLTKWLKHRSIPGKLWRLSTIHDEEDFILSARLEQQGCYDSITENGVHYGVEVFGLIFDNLSSQGLTLDDWIQDFTSLSSEFATEMLEEF